MSKDGMSKNEDDAGQRKTDRHAQPIQAVFIPFKKGSDR